ncbi:RNA polymerase I subunit Rpa43, putative [Cordyceps militaris CM01]|uniref:DNA-directed RNA polymerase subunit n=1 Tax=Cordyceps militaris (strain CM01) TaxID=983644 RepID=G3JV16_CORMM|nr:RNA polymerase I subunit Rpa43, putative [Cordyceps militaris CM01]EGX87692.1 RNA polymerase I subunit Rpa43, putative [Cordyceps militaris CM01]
MPAAASPEPVTPKADKKAKKSHKSDKKRSREEDAAVDPEERKHKKSKSVSADASNEHEDVAGKKEKKKKKSKQDSTVDGDKAEQKKSKKKHVDSEKKSERKKKKSKTDSDDVVVIVTDAEDGMAQSQLEIVSAQAADDFMDLDEPATNYISNIYQPPDIPAEPQFPFFSQTVSLYEPIYPIGWAQPVTNCEYHYLRHLQNKYVPSLRGVLMNYKNVTLGDEPGRVGAATNDEEETTLKSQREFGVGFGWITADVDLFVPSRGAWMEGSVNLQTEGHIGVVCFGKFNASIEARRLPPSWKWVSNEDPEAEGMEETASIVAPDEHGVVHQIHSTGFWVDAHGDKVKGKIRFRIRNFDVGVSGETTYLSLEGTMLDKASEKTLVQQEGHALKMRRNTKTNRRLERRRAPEFSMTRFFSEEEKQAHEKREAAKAAAQAERAAAAAEEETAAATSEGTKIVFDE